MFVIGSNSSLCGITNFLTARHRRTRWLPLPRNYRKKLQTLLKEISLTCSRRNSQQALIIAFNEAKLYPGMFASTNAILFFGCPHLGSSAADYVQILARIVNAAFIGSHISSITGVIRTDLFKSLQRNSSELLKIAEDFRVHTGQMQIASFVEKKKMKGLNAVVSCKVPFFAARLFA